MTSPFSTGLEMAGFSRASTAIAVRTVATCYGMCFHPDDNPVIGIGLFKVVPSGDGYQFSVGSRALRDGEMPGDLLEWLEPQLAETAPIIGWQLPAMVRRLSSFSSPDRHPRIDALVRRGEARLRNLPPDVRPTIKRRGVSMPCLCTSLKDCVPQLPIELLPPAHETETALIYEAADAWLSWANLHGDFDDPDHPARIAIRALRHMGGVPRLFED